MTDLAHYHYPEQYRALLSNTEKHELKILHEDGLYRHLRFQEPGTSIWYFDLITWPGSLAIRGDIGQGYVFTRTDDMLRFFDHGQAAGHINADYWAEKLDQGRRSVKDFSSKEFRAWCREHHGGAGLFPAADEVDYELEAIDLLDEHGVHWDDVNDWHDYEYHFILALHAILWGAKKYHASKREEIPT